MSINVYGFSATFPLLPVKTKNRDDKKDEAGFLVDDEGRRILKRQQEVWVTYGPKDDPLRSRITERLRHLDPNGLFRHGVDRNVVTNSLAYKVMAEKFKIIKEKYDLWLESQTLKGGENGTPLDVIPFVSEMNVINLNALNIFTAEDVLNASNDLLEEAQLGNVKTFKNKINKYLKALSVEAEFEQALVDDLLLDADALTENNG